MKHTEQDHQSLSDQLRKATRRGDLGGAYSILGTLRRTGDADDAQRVLLRAGHSVVSTKSRTFWLFAQSEIAKACRSLCDGFEMQQARQPAGAGRTH